MARHQASRCFRNAILDRGVPARARSLSALQFFFSFFSRTLFTGRSFFFAVRRLEINPAHQLCLQ
jgi:hypothetical protein